MEPNTGGPAFPTASADDGMTLQDWFAGQALATVTRVPLGNTIHDENGTADKLAAWAYRVADAMMRHRAL